MPAVLSDAMGGLFSCLHGFLRRSSLPLPPMLLRSWLIIQLRTGFFGGGRGVFAEMRTRAQTGATSSVVCVGKNLGRYLLGVYSREVGLWNMEMQGWRRPPLLANDRGGHPPPPPLPLPFFSHPEIGQVRMYLFFFLLFFSLPTRAVASCMSRCHGRVNRNK